MKKILLKSLALAALGVSMMAGNAVAGLMNDNRPFTDFGSNSEPTLQQVLNNVTNNTGPNVTAQDDTAIWAQSDGDGSAYLVSSNTAGGGIFGIYSYSTSLEVDFTFKTDLTNASFSFINGDTLLIDDGLGTRTFENFGYDFGFYLKNGNFTGYTEDSKNTSGGYGVDNNILALAYRLDSGVTYNLSGTINGSPTTSTRTTNGNDDWILAFDDWASGDGDFQDRLFYIEDLKSVPEPTAMVLFGTGLVGLIAMGRRKKIKK